MATALSWTAQNDASRSALDRGDRRGIRQTCTSVVERLDGFDAALIGTTGWLDIVQDWWYGKIATGSSLPAAATTPYQASHTAGNHPLAGGEL